MNFLDYSNDENKFKFKDNRYEEKMEVLFFNGYFKDDKVKDDKNFYRLVFKVRNIILFIES